MDGAVIMTDIRALKEENRGPRPFGLRRLRGRHRHAPCPGGSWAEDLCGDARGLLVHLYAVYIHIVALAYR